MLEQEVLVGLDELRVLRHAGLVLGDPLAVRLDGLFVLVHPLLDFLENELVVLEDLLLLLQNAPMLTRDVTNDVTTKYSKVFDIWLAITHCNYCNYAL